MRKQRYYQSVKTSSGSNSNNLVFNLPSKTDAPRKGLGVPRETPKLSMGGDSKSYHESFEEQHSSIHHTTHSHLSNQDEEDTQNHEKQKRLKRIKKKIQNSSCTIKLNAYAKLYVIMATFCVLWLPFCILWPINAVCQSCINPFIFQLSYWMGYAQSLINPILLLILNPNYNKLKSDS